MRAPGLGRCRHFCGAAARAALGGGDPVCTRRIRYGTAQALGLGAVPGVEPVRLSADPSRSPNARPAPARDGA